MYLGTIAVLTTFALDVKGRLEPLPDELSSRSSLAKCVGESSDRFFEEGEILLVSLPIHEVSVSQPSAVLFNTLLLFELSWRCRLSVVIKKTTKSRKNENYQKNIDNYVIQVRNVSELTENLNVLQGYSSWNPHAKFMVVSVAIYPDNTAAAAAIVQQLWNAKVANGIVLLPCHQNTSIFEVYSWFPFANGHCGDGFDELEIIDHCSYGTFRVGFNWFPNKIPQNLNGCPIRVRTVVWPPYVLPPERKSTISKQYIFNHGLEILLMNTLAEIGNFSVIYSISDMEQDWGIIYNNGTATGALLVLKNEEVDVAISSFAATIETHMYFDTIPYDMPESLRWCVPSATQVPSWQNLLIVISPDTWFALIVMYIIVSLCLWRLSLFETKESKSYKTFTTCLQHTLSIMVSMAVPIQPKSISVRLFFLLWIFFSLHLDVVYQTSLTSVFTKPRYETQIDTFSEIMQNNLNLWFLSITKRYFLGNEDWLSQTVLKNWNDCEDINKCLYKTAYTRDSATCTPRLFQEFVNNRYVTINNEPLLYCFQESLVTFPLEMLMRKGYPLKQHFIRLVGRISSSGLKAQWEKQLLEDRANFEVSQQDGQGTKFKITIDHLNTLFVLLSLGYIGGFAILFLEIFYHRRKKRV